VAFIKQTRKNCQLTVSKSLMNEGQKSPQAHLAHPADGSPNNNGDRALHACEPDEVVPGALRERLRWDWQQDVAAAEVMQEYGLSLPKDRKLIRRLAVTRVVWGKPEWL